MSKVKTALIVGSKGQDGTILTKLLLKKKYQVIGIDRGEKIDITNPNQVEKLIARLKPQEIYYLAAFHSSSQDKQLEPMELFKRSYEINVFGYLNFLEAIRKKSPNTRIFYAASSMIFGNPKKEIQTEESPYCPNTPYGITKLDGVLIARLYREQYKVFASCGILFNHESEYRQENFITTKIIQGAIDVKQGIREKVEVGSLSAKVDWGYAYDYALVMTKILKLKSPDDFIIATNKLHTVADLARVAFSSLGLNWKKYVFENANVLTRKKGGIRGDTSKLSKLTGWKPSLSFEEMIEKIIKVRMKQKNGML